MQVFLFVKNWAHGKSGCPSTTRELRRLGAPTKIWQANHATGKCISSVRAESKLRVTWKGMELEDEMVGDNKFFRKEQLSAEAVREVCMRKLECLFICWFVG